MYPIITGRSEVVAKVMFLHVSVILSTGGSPENPLPGTRQTPRDQADPPWDQVDIPPGPGRPPPLAGRTPPTRQTPPDQADPPGSGRPPGKKTPAYGQ